MTKIDWLKTQIHLWQRLNFVSPDQAATIIAYYEAQPSANLARIVLSVAGAVLFGLGVILFFAWNWDAMPKVAKLGVVFSGLITAQLSGIWFLLRVGNKPLGEGLLGLGTLLFGAGIVLVAQIYHIDEHNPNAFIVWGLGALAMAWAVASVTQGYLALVLLSVWFGIEFSTFSAPMHEAAPLIGIGLLTLAWRERAYWLFFLATLAFVFTLLTSAIYESGQWFIVDLMLIAAAFVVAAPSAERTSFPDVETILRRLGYLGYIGVMYFLSFQRIHNVFDNPVANDDVALAYFAFLLFVALTALALGIKREIGLPKRIDQLHQILVVISTFIAVAALTISGKVGLWIWIWANLALIVHSVIWIVVGAREQRARVVAGAAILFVLVAVPRFLDLFDSLLMRSLMFVALGAGLFLLGNFYQRRKRPQGIEAHP